MKRTILLILLFLAVLFQTAVFPNFTIWGVFPNILLIIIVSFCFTENYFEASIWAVFGGFMLDIFSAKSFGLSAISLMSVVVVFYFISSSLEFAKVYSKIILSSISSFVYYVVLIIFSIIFDLMKFSDNLLHLDLKILRIILISTIINTTLIVLISPLVSLFNEWLNKVEKRLETKYL